MPTEIVMPRLSDTMDRGTVARWNKQTGEAIKRGEVLLEIETDKANMDLEAYSDGILAQIMVGPGESAAVGAPIGIVARDEGELEQIRSGRAGGGTAGSGPPDREQARKATPKAESSGAGEAGPPAPRTTEPMTDGIAPRAAGMEASASTGESLGDAPHEGGRIKASPVARRMAQQLHVDLHGVTGTGPGGRIVRDDVEALAREGPAGSAQPAAYQPAPPDSETQLSRMQLAVGRRLTESKLAAPHFYVTTEIDMTHASRMRAQINAAEPELRVSFNDLILKATGVVLARSPAVNVSLREDRLIRHASVNLGIAVDLPEGLIVPVARDVDRKGLRTLVPEIKDLVERARDRKLKQSELEGGTFTVSNLGMLGVDEFTAIINPPESAIMAVGAIVDKPVVVDGEIVVRARMRVTLSCDHRVIYGAAAAAFLAELRRTLEHPVLALM